MKLLIMLAFVIFSATQAHAAPNAADRIAIEAGVKSSVASDLSQPYQVHVRFADRKCLDGRPVDGFSGDVIEYWANLECFYCGIHEPLQAQRENQNICIVVRHIPSDAYSESMKKALSFEALRSFSNNAANQFWNMVIPKTSPAIPVPYESSLQNALEQAAISIDDFSKALEQATLRVGSDILEAKDRISATPTYELAGIRFPACDFKSGELIKALKLAKKAREGDEAAKNEIIQIIVRGFLNETLL